MAVRPKTWGILGSIFLHGLLAAVTINLGVQEGVLKVDKAPPPAPGSAGSGSFDPASELARYPYRPSDAPMPDLGKLLQDSEDQAARMTPKQREAALMKHLAKAADIPPAHVDQAARVVEAFKGVDQNRQWAPRPGVGGAYDVDSSVLHDIHKTVVDGKDVYVFTLVDKDGRSMTANVDGSQMTPEDLRTFQLYELARKNEGLRRLMEAAVKIHEAQNPDKK